MRSYKRITAAQRRRMYLEQIEVLRRAPAFAKTLEAHRTKALRDTLQLYVGSEVTSDFRINIDEPYMTDWYRQLYSTVGAPVAERQFDKFAHNSKKSALNDLWGAAINNYIDQWVGTKITLIGDSFARWVAKFVKEAVRESMKETSSGISVMTDDVYGEVMKKWKEVRRWQVMRIVNVEVMSAKSVSQHVSVDSLGVPYKKQWVTAFHNSRQWHEDMDGVIVDAGEYFYPDGEQMEYPRDVRFGASARNIINCMCDCDYIQTRYDDLG